jgi:NADP-dependent 3-hydroxy acid dehydrogenase YdfG
MITGATSGIGLATAHLLASQGYRLILTGRRLDRLESIEQQIKEQFQTKTHCLNFDVRHLEETRQAILSLDENWGQIDILINNAGLASGFESIHEGHIDDWETMIDTNIKGLLYMTRAIAPQMVARQKGHIINISSAAAIDAYPKGNVYCATKAAVEMLTKSIRLDLYQYGIRVSQVSPGHVEETEFAKVRFHGDLEKAQIYKDFQPLKARDVADAIWYMISRPEYVNINDIVMTSTQQANTIFINRNGRKEDLESE